MVVGISKLVLITWTILMQQAKNRRRSNASLGTRGSKIEATPGAPERLQKVLAAAGIASRRQCEKLILEGRVEVDQRVITKLGTKVEPDTQVVRVDGVPLVRSRQVYYMINKPKGVVCTHRDPAGRMRIIDLIPDETSRMFSVGRLDRESEGLILLTNDGGMAQQLAHPRYGVDKTYHVQVAGLTDRGLLQRLREGVQLKEGKISVAAVKMKRTHKQSSVLEIKLREGKNREIRRMLAALGHKVQRLKRVGLGPLKLGKLPQGEARALQRSELTALRQLVTAEDNNDHQSRRDLRKDREQLKGSGARATGGRRRSTGGTKKTKPNTSKKKKSVRKNR